MFLENVRIPVANRVGEENKGWDYAKYLLGHERSGIARVGISKMRLRRARMLAERIPMGSSTLAQDPNFLERAAALEIELKALEITQMRVIAESSRGAAGKTDPKTSILKIKGSELQQAATELLLSVAGYEALEYDGDFLRGLREGDDEVDWARTLAPNHYFARHVSIVGGSNEIQHNILAKSILGL
jgi:alkylation response protein AidB-like acyl-CoA dehydrogenase